MAAAAIPIGLLVGAFLWINEFPDRRADARAGKRTLVVRLGPRRAAQAFVVLIGAAAVALALLPIIGFPPAILFGAAGLVPAVAAARRLLAFSDTTARIVPAQGWTLLSFLTASVGMSLGVLLG